MTIVAALLGIMAVVCFIIMLIDAFKDEFWKGLLGFFCGLYLVYYTIFESDMDYRWLIALGYIVGAVGCRAVLTMAATSAGVPTFR